MALVIASWSPSAHAEDAAVEKRAADAALQAGDAREALRLYQGLYATHPEPALLYNIARAHAALGHHAQAYRAFEDFGQRASPELLARVPMLLGLMRAERNKTTALDVHCDVEGAVVSARGETVGATPLAPTLVDAGEAEVRITREGYQPFIRMLALPEGSTTRVDVHLVPLASMGRLALATSPSGASVTLDGAPRGNTPFEDLVAPGEHRLVLTKEGYASQSASIRIQAGQTAEAHYDLATEKTLTSRWWFWTGLGVAVAAGSVGVVYAFTHTKEADSGTLGPGRITTLYSF